MLELGLHTVDLHCTILPAQLPVLLFLSYKCEEVKL